MFDTQQTLRLLRKSLLHKPAWRLTIYPQEQYSPQEPLCESASPASAFWHPSLSSTLQSCGPFRGGRSLSSLAGSTLSPGPSLPSLPISFPWQLLNCSWAPGQNRTMSGQGGHCSSRSFLSSSVLAVDSGPHHPSGAFPEAQNSTICYRERSWEPQDPRATRA